ncbi:putative Cyclin-dependent kinase inhibitor-containing protein 2 [Homarus americanus]|uniref:Putative Cyclin-dependent kinase inhibitor-containing protein 2 n=1 Tax=Homarus americanus TaxID=6706 RepID=A0A8J5JYF7_HOMAM|nr:putative Cyclin-dependent kinase inhibitor-containing protein 2 [Homarus americanus]
MVVLQPFKPGKERMRLVLKRGQARRALPLGQNNTKHNLEMAESLLTISAEEFTKKWNFDPIREVPVSGGRYQWHRVTSYDHATTSPHPATQSKDQCAILVNNRPRNSCGCDLTTVSCGCGPYTSRSSDCSQETAESDRTSTEGTKSNSDSTTTYDNDKLTPGRAVTPPHTTRDIC